MNFTTIVRNLILALAIGAIASLAQAAKPDKSGNGGGGGGGGGKVSVTAAEPSEANQGEELDVVISGEGFDDGSAATFYITGTDDDTQITVLANEYLPSTGQLKARIRVQGAAAVTDYDIEVRNSRGRRGKGTTLFKVQKYVEEYTCTGLEDPAPGIAYLTALDTSGDIHTADILLASDSGCDTYLLVESAAQEIPYTTQDPGGAISDVSDLRLDIEGGLGVIIWRDRSETIGPPEYNSLTFVFDGSEVLVDPAGPQALYVPPDDWRPYRADVRVSDVGGYELAVTEKPVGIDSYRLVYVDIDSITGETREVLADGMCPILDASGTCYRLGGAYWSLWNGDGREVYFTARAWPEDTHSAIARFRRNDDGWQPAEVLIKHENNGIEVDGINADGLISYRWLERQFNKGGKVVSSRRVASIIDPDACSLVQCAPGDGLEIAISGAHPHHPGQWTRDGGMLYGDFVGNDILLWKYADPLTGQNAPFNPVGPVEGSNSTRDTSF